MTGYVWISLTSSCAPHCSLEIFMMLWNGLVVNLSMTSSSSKSYLCVTVRYIIKTYSSIHSLNQFGSATQSGLIPKLITISRLILLMPSQS